jgi:AraC family transcriptional activator of pobA
MKNDGIPLHSIEQAIADFEGQWKGKDFYVVTSDSIGTRRQMIPCPFRTDYMAIFVATGGNASVTLNQTLYPLERNSLLVVSPNTVRDMIDTGKDASVVGIIFSRNFLIKSGLNERSLAAFDFFLLRSNPHLLLEQEDADTLLSLMLLLKKKSREVKDKAYTEEMVRHYFMAFLYELASLYRKLTGLTVKRTRKEDLHIRFHQLLSEHIKRERSVRFYAAKLFVTPKYLSETVKEVTGGKTAGEVIDEMVMIEAKHLLKDPTISVTEVAAILHFSDQFFFRKFFKRHGGMTPSEYRRVEA